MLAGCAELADPEDPGDGPQGEDIYVDEPRTSTIAPDPAAAVETGWCYGNYAWAGTSARLYYPANGSCASSVYSPLVIILPGFGYPHTDYHYLARHLAKNNYIVAAIQALPNGVTVDAYEAAAEQAWDFVYDFAWSEWSKGPFIDPAHIGLIGHSRGGETVRYLAEDLAGNATFHVRSVIALAPTNYEDIRLDGTNTESAMVLIGTKDGDQVPERAYEVHDHASSEASQFDGFVLNPAVIWRSLKLFTDAGHPGFAADGDQGHMTQGYALAFFDAHLKNEQTYYEDYIRRNERPAGGFYNTTSQYSDGLYRRVIDNFEDGMTANSTIGGIVGQAAGTGGVIDVNMNNSTPHRTRLLHYTPPANGSGFSWAIPAAKSDETSYAYLSLRVGQISGPITDDLRVRISNAGVISSWVRLTDHGELAQPLDMCVAGGGCSDIEAQNHMGTIRIPLDAFGAHNNVTGVTLGATAEATDGEFYLDNLEFSELSPP